MKEVAVVGGGGDRPKTSLYIRRLPLSHTFWHIRTLATEERRRRGRQGTKLSLGDRKGRLLKSLPLSPLPVTCQSQKRGEGKPKKERPISLPSLFLQIPISNSFGEMGLSVAASVHMLLSNGGSGLMLWFLLWKGGEKEEKGVH